MTSDTAEAGALALDGVLESADALEPDSLEAELHDDSPSIASRPAIDAAARLLTRYIASLTLEAPRRPSAHAPAIT